MLSRLASKNIGQANFFYLELNALFIYNTTFVKIYLELISKILAKYKANNYWSYFYYQIQANKNFAIDKTLLFFISSLSTVLDADSYITLCPKNTFNKPFPYLVDIPLKKAEEIFFLNNAREPTSYLEGHPKQLKDY